MKAKKHRISLLYLFGAVFILGGIMTLFTAAQDMYKLLSAAYRQQIDSSVLSVRVESDWIEHTDTRSMAADTQDWITEEEIQINGQIFIYQGKYPSDPGGTVTHTVISDDGMHWEVNDSSTEGTILCIIVGIFCVLLGIGIILRVT